MDPAPPKPSALRLIRWGFGALFRPPFRTLWLLTLLVAAASPSLGTSTDGVSLAATLLFVLVTFLLEMAVVLAAAHETPELSADTWIRAALRRRAFWRFVVTGIVTDVAVGAGLLVLIIGGLVIAGIVGLAPQAALLERKLPFQALARSAELTRPVRGQIATVYGLLVLVPTLIAVVPYLTGAEVTASIQTAIGAVTSTVGLAASIALTKAFVELGGLTSEQGAVVEEGTGAIR